MLIKFKLSVLSLLCLLSVAFCSKAVTGQEVKSPLSGIEHVLLIGADGFGAHYVHWNELPNLNIMKENGAWTLHMRSVLPSVSAINWATILMGAPSEMHGFREWGSKKPDLPSIYLTAKGKFPCIFSVVRAQIPNAKTAAVFDWDNIQNLYESSEVNEQQFISSNKIEDVTNTALKMLEKKPNFMFVYYGLPDTVGHEIGWGTPEYQKSLTTVDTQVGKLLEFLKKNDMAQHTIVLFIADHGGTEKGHGKGIMEHMEVPWLVYGPGVHKGEIKNVVVNYDNTATIAWILGLKAPQAWRGLPILSAFGK